MTSFKQFRLTFQMLFSGLPNFLDVYWKKFEKKELDNCKTDGGNGRNHCVYEQRIDEKKIDEENNPDGTTISSIIVPDSEHPQKKEILCISAPNGYAKEFFAKRLCLLNHDKSDTKKNNVWSRVFCFQGRIPIIITMQDINTLHDDGNHELSGEYSELCFLCMNSMKRFVSENKMKWPGLFKQVQWSGKFEKMLLIVLSKLLEKGNLFILFEKNTNIFAKELKRIAEEGISEEDREIRKNLLVFVFDDEGDNPFDLGFYSVKLSRLSRKEVMDHIEISVGGKTDLWRDVDRLFDKIPELMIPDCLLFVVETHQNGIRNPSGLRTAAELYRDCIEVVIEDRVPENIEETWRQLQNYALLENGERHDVEGELQKLTPRSGERNHLLHANGQFRFEGCREYLIAESIYDKLNSMSGEEPGQVERLLDNIEGNIVRRLIEIAAQRCKDNRGEIVALNKLSDYLFNDAEGTMNVDFNLLITFAEYTIDVEDVDCEEAFIARIKGELLKPIYDNRIFDMITESNKKLHAWKINSKLRNIYLKSIKNRTEIRGYEEDRFNRRFLFYYGTYNKLDKEILSGFGERTLHSHVKYHLARALIDNALKAKREKNESDMEFFRNAQKFMDNEEVEKDTILKGQRLALKLIFGEKIHLSTEDESLVRELKSLLSHEDYWKRAHAADTLGHLESSDIREIPSSLIKAIADEMERKDENYERKKVIGYTTEAVCIFFYISCFLKKKQTGFRDMQEVGKGFGIVMLQMIRLDGLNQNANREFTMSVFAVLAEGALYLTNQKYDEMPNFSGRHITNSEERWDENTKLIVRAFERAKDSCNNNEEKERIKVRLKDFRNKVDEIRGETEAAKQEMAEMSVGEKTEMPDAEMLKNDSQEISKARKNEDVTSVVNIYVNEAKTIENEIIIEGKEGSSGMNVINNGPVTNQQNVESGASGNQMVNTLKGYSIAEFKEEFKELLKGSFEEKQPEIDSVMEELSSAVNSGEACQKDEEHWKGRFLTALSAGANVATITSASWWPLLTNKIHQFFLNLPL